MRRDAIDGSRISFSKRVCSQLGVTSSTECANTFFLEPVMVFCGNAMSSSWDPALGAWNTAECRCKVEQR